MIQRPGGELGGHVRGAVELKWTRSRQLDRAAYPILMIGRLCQCLESITPVKQYAKASVALRHGVEGAQPQHLEFGDQLLIGADLGSKVLELAAMIDSKHHQVFIGPCASGSPVYMLELRILTQAKLAFARREKKFQFRPSRHRRRAAMP